MIAKRSPLSWHNFALLQSYFKYVDPSPNKEPVDVESLFGGYVVDVDFVVKKPVGGKRQVFTKVAINWQAEGDMGYKIFVEGVGLFGIEGEDSLPEEVRKNLVFYSTVNMMLNRLRSHIHELTVTSALGAYMLPAVDVTDLFRQKAQKKNEPVVAKKAGKKVAKKVTKKP